MPPKRSHRPDKDSWLKKRFRKIRGRALSLLGKDIVRNQGVVLSTSDPVISSKLQRQLYRGAYEKPEADILKATLRETDIVLELGAGIGFISILAAKTVGSDRVFTYEANPGAIPVIRRNYQLNGVMPNLRNAALSADTRRAERTLHVGNNLSGGSFYQQGETREEIRVPVASLKEEIASIGPSYLIVDIEGAEKDILSRETLRSVERVLIELHPDIIGRSSTDAIRSSLKDWGYSEDMSVSYGDVRYFYRA